MTTAERILRICQQWVGDDPIMIEEIWQQLNVADDPEATYSEILGALIILVDEASIDIGYDGVITLTIAGEE